MSFWSTKAKQKVNASARLRRITILAELPDDDLLDECYRRVDKLQEELIALNQKGIQFTLFRTIK